MEVQPPIDEFLPDDVAVVSTTAPSRTSLFSGFQRSKPLKSKLVEGISSTADRMRNVSFLRGKTEKHKAEPVVPCVSSIWNWEFTPTMTDPRWLPSEAHEVHKSAVSSIQISSGCELVFTTSQDSTFKITVVEDGSQKRSLACHLALSSCGMTKDEKIVFIGSW